MTRNELSKYFLFAGQNRLIYGSFYFGDQPKIFDLSKYFWALEILAQKLPFC